ncbi:MAG: GH3 auxin-responsive promoter family protein [Lentisphaerota bacterium]
MEAFDIQSGLYKQMKQALTGTKIYQDMGLERINTYEEYVQKVPIGDYEFYERYVKELETTPNILFKDELRYYGRCTGTSVQYSKKIPYNSAMIELFLRFQKNIAEIVLDQAAGVNPATSMQFTYGSQLVSNNTGKIPEGYISGLIAAFASKNFKSDLLFPSIAALRIPDWAEKMAAIVEEVKDKDIRVISGVPSYLINILEEIANRLKIKNLREIWPNLEVCCYSGTPIQNHRQCLDELAGLPLKYVGIYLSTEAPLGLTRTTSSDYSFNTGSILYSFNRFDEPDGKTLGIQEIEPGGEYLVNIGAPNGFVKYAIKDVVRITKTTPDIEFQVIGRQGTAIDIANERVSFVAINSVVSEIEKKLALPVRHYFLYPSQNNHIPCYEWIIICDNARNIPAEIISNTIDQELMTLTQRYKDRRANGTIGTPVVKVVPAGLEKDYFEKYNQKGQLKMKSIFDSKNSFIAFVQQLGQESAAKLNMGQQCR